MLGLNTSETTDFVAFDVRLYLHMSVYGILTHSVILFHTVPRFLRLARLAHASYSPRYYIKVNNSFVLCLPGILLGFTVPPTNSKPILLTNFRNIPSVL